MTINAGSRNPIEIEPKLSVPLQGSETITELAFIGTLPVGAIGAATITENANNTFLTDDFQLVSDGVDGSGFPQFITSNLSNGGISDMPISFWNQAVDFSVFASDDVTLITDLGNHNLDVNGVFSFIWSFNLATGKYNMHASFGGLTARVSFSV